MTKIHGHTAAGYEHIHRAFEQNFKDHGDVGAACCLYHNGKPVVDLWAGIANPDNDLAWNENTVQLIFSATKGITAICINRLIQDGILDLDTPIADYWPEFAENGKASITLKMVLSHRAGLAAVNGELTLDEVLAWHPVVEVIARQAVNWEPDSTHGYHARSFGWILGEVVRRTTGQSLGQWFQQEIARPLKLDLWIGLPEEQLPRCAKIIPPLGGKDLIAELLGDASLTAKVMSGPNKLFNYDDMWNDPKLLMAEMPSSNGVGNARSLAKLYAATIGACETGACETGPCARDVSESASDIGTSKNTSLLTTDILKQACEVCSCGPDAVILRPSKFGLGFALPPFLSPDCGPKSFGHPGAGGSFGFGDPETGIGFAYITNVMRFDAEGDPRTANLLKALYACLNG